MIGIPNNNHLTAFPVQEEEEDLPEDFLRLEVDFGEVFEKEQEDSALMDLLGKLCLKAGLDSKFSYFLNYIPNVLSDEVSDPIQERGDHKRYNENRRDKKRNDRMLLKFRQASARQTNSFDIWEVLIRMVNIYTRSHFLHLDL